MATGLTVRRDGISGWGLATAATFAVALHLGGPVGAAPTVLEAGKLRLTLDDRGALTSLCRPGEVELLAAGSEAPPLRFGVSLPVANAPGKLLEFGADRARSVQIEPVTATADGGRMVRVRFAEFAVEGAPQGVARLTAWFTATILPGEDVVSLRLGAEVPEPLVLEYVQGPTLAVASGADSKLVTGVSKGGVAERVLLDLAATGDAPGFVLCVGDDRSDEDMFAAMEGHVAFSPHVQAEVFACTVGQKPSRAPFYVNEPADVAAALELLAETRPAAPGGGGALSPRPSRGGGAGGVGAALLAQAMDE